MRMFEVLQHHRLEIREAVARCNAKNPRVFGSVARGEDRENSDIDIVVDSLPGMTAFDLGKLQHELEMLLGRYVDLVTFGGLNAKIQEIILIEARFI